LFCFPIVPRYAEVDQQNVVFTAFLDQAAVNYEDLAFRQALS